MQTTKKVYNRILKETRDVPENMPYNLVKLYMQEYGKIVVDECAKVQHETPPGHMYSKIMEVKDRLK